MRVPFALSRAQHDITDQKRDAYKLLRFGAAMDALADAIYLTDRSSMRFIYVNDAACRMQNETREGMIVRGPGRVFSSSLAELARICDAIITSGVDAKPVEMMLRRHDDSRTMGRIAATS